MGEVAELGRMLYERLLMRDVLGKVVPGASLLVALSPASRRTLRFGLGLPDEPAFWTIVVIGLVAWFGGLLLQTTGWLLGCWVWNVCDCSRAQKPAGCSACFEYVSRSA